MLRTRSCQLSTKAIARLAPCCVAALFSISALTQTPPAYSIELSTPGTSNADNCSPSNSHFGADIERLSDTIEESADIPPEFLLKYFAGCTIEKARELLNKSGFRAGKPEPEFDDSEPKKVIPRTLVIGKTMRSFDQLVSLNCRIVLKNDASNGLSVFGFFYFDGP